MLGGRNWPAWNLRRFFLKKWKKEDFKGKAYFVYIVLDLTRFDWNTQVQITVVIYNCKIFCIWREIKTQDTAFNTCSIEILFEICLWFFVSSARTLVFHCISKAYFAVFKEKARINWAKSEKIECKTKQFSRTHEVFGI